MIRSIGRRDFLIVTTGSALLGSLVTHGKTPSGQAGQGGLPLSAQAQPPPKPNLPRILALFSYGMGIYYFNPAGLYINLGQSVQWAGVGRYPVSAYHPSLGNHELRIPEAAKPFTSRTASGAEDGMFTWTFDVEGTYDYYSEPHEALGMVGRIVVGKPGGPAEKPPGYGNREGRAVMYSDAARLLNFLKPDEIVRQKVVPCPLQLLERKFPWR
jgi:plastocyanin